MVFEVNVSLLWNFPLGLNSWLSSEIRRTMRCWLSRRTGVPVLKHLKIVISTVSILMALSVSADAQQLLSAAEIEGQIVGHSFRGKKGIVSVSLDYSPDGTVTMRSAVGTGTGRWIISDNQLCVRIETGPRKASECMTFTSEPDGAYRTSNGMRLIPEE